MKGNYAEYIIGLLMILVLIRQASQISDLYIVDLIGMGLILGGLGYVLFSRMGEW